MSDITHSNNGVDILTLAERRLEWLEKRQTVLAGNVANVNTPGYKPKDITSFQNILNQHTAATLTQTNPNHLSGIGEGTRTLRRGGIASPDGNEVNIEEELEKVASNNDQQRLATNSYSVYNSMFSIVIGAEK